MKGLQNDFKSIETYKTIELSCNHMTLADTKLLDRLSLQELTRVAKRPSGYFWKVDNDMLREELVSPRFSKELLHIIELCTTNGIACIEFDCDSQVVDDLPVFDW